MKTVRRLLYREVVVAVALVTLVIVVVLWS